MRRELISASLIVILCLFAWIREPRFFEPQSLNSILLYLPMVAIAAVGQLPVILTGGIDISVGSILGFTGIAVGLMFQSNSHLPIVAAFLFSGLAGGLLGAVNGALVSWGRLPAIVVTIGTLSAFRGLTFLLSRGNQVDSTMLPSSFTNLVQQGIHIGSVTLNEPLLLVFLFAFVASIGLGYTQFGRNVYSVGNNIKAAYLRGISTQWILFSVYAFSGFTAGVSGAIYASRFGFVNPESAGKSFELTVIAAVAIGGVKITGGYGSVLGALLGCLFLACLNVALSVLGINANWQLMVYGLLIILAVLLDSLLRMTKRKAAV